MDLFRMEISMKCWRIARHIWPRQAARTVSRLVTCLNRVLHQPVSTTGENGVLAKDDGNIELVHHHVVTGRCLAGRWKEAWRSSDCYVCEPGEPFFELSSWQCWTTHLSCRTQPLEISRPSASWRYVENGMYLIQWRRFRGRGQVLHVMCIYAYDIMIYR